MIVSPSPRKPSGCATSSVTNGMYGCKRRSAFQNTSRRIATDVPGAASEAASLKKAMRAESVEFVPAGSDLAMPSKITKFGTAYLSLEGLVDKAAEAKRIAGELAKIGGFIKSAEAKLANPQFVDHAPAAIVDGQRAKLAELKANLAKLEKLATLFA